MFTHHHPATKLALQTLETTATLHGYAVAFWWAAGFFAAGAIVTFLLLESGVSVATTPVLATPPIDV